MMYVFAAITYISSVHTSKSLYKYLYTCSAEEAASYTFNFFRDHLQVAAGLLLCGPSLPFCLPASYVLAGDTVTAIRCPCRT